MNIFHHPRWKKIMSRITHVKSRINKMKVWIVANIKPGLSKIKTHFTTELKPRFIKLKSKMPNIKLPIANIKFFNANIRQIGILLMLGIFVTTGMIGNIQAAAPEETIVSTVKAQKVLLNGKEVGYVCDQQSAHIVMDEVLMDAADIYDMEVSAKCNLTFEEVMIAPELLTTKIELEQSLRQSSEINVNAYVIYANNEKIGTLKCEEDAEQMLDGIKAQYTDDIDDLEDVYFQEEVEILPTPVAFYEVQDIETVEANIQNGQETVEEYSIQEGDTLWSISQRFEINHDELTEMNADVDPGKLQLGQTVRLSYPKNLLNVVTTEVIEYEKSIPYETETKKDSSMFSNQSKIIQDGKEGLKNVEARVVKLNGIEQEKEVISETIIEEPVNKIVAKGTKTPVSRGSGRLSWPAKGRLTSRYGSRWGRMHNGIDIANSTGTAIYAADSGKVIFSGRSGSYGNLVQIDHGSGMVTYYAHMSKRAVSKGNSVSKGQVIGYIGSTGRSTGPHLHFEVRINGSAKNPLKYLP